MSLNGIMSSALTALQTNQTALGTVSNNIANMNTTGYVRRVVNEQAQVAGGQLTGVDIADIQRVTDQFLNQEVLTAQGTSSQYGAINDTLNQLNGFLGQPGDGSALTSQLSNVFSALSASTLAPSSGANQQGALTAFQNMASTISSLSGEITSLQTTVDQKVTSSVGTANSLIKQIYDLNSQISTASASGDTASGLLDQRDQAVQKLSQMMGLRTAAGSNGQVVVSTPDGVQLVGDTYAQLSYQGGASNGTYGTIELSNVNPATGNTIGQPMALDPHLGSGSLKGLIDARDGTLAQLKTELGNFASQTANAFNSVHNANTAFPPPTTMDGRDTGLLSSDALNFSGKTTIAIADSGGNLVSRVDVNFSAGTLSVDGGPATGIGSTVGSFVTALNSALGANGTASFSNGALSIHASGTNGVVISDDPSTPASRGGSGFSQFFGLNDLFRTSTPTIKATGLSASDAGGFTPGTMSFTLKGPDGQVAKTATVSVAAGDSIGTIVSNLNSAFGGTMNFALGSDGTLTATPASGYSSDTLNVTSDTTQRGGTGLSFSTLFGLGVTAAGAPADGFTVNPAISADPQQLAFAQANLSGATAGSSIVNPGDARGLLALQQVSNVKFSFAKAGGMAAQSASLSDYAANFYQDIATRSQAASTNNTAQSDRLTEAQTRQSSVSGVNLDQELTNMMTYQQAYSAGARILQTVQSLYTTLLQIQ